jgi:electron transfer flavoprotein alpha subunit
MIVLIIEMAGKTIPAVSMELLSLALQLKKESQAEVVALVYGKEAENGAGWFAAESGLKTMGLITEEKNLLGIDMADALIDILPPHAPRHLLFPHTLSSMELAPALAVAFGLPLVAGVAHFADEAKAFHRSVSGGKTRLHVEAEQGAVITVHPGAFEAPPKPGIPGEVILNKQFHPEGRARILSTQALNSGASNLPGARVVVSAGRGIESEDHLPLFKRLADALPGAAKGCSRPLVDMGWLPYPCQVGITGATISADLYIALGISGSTQHLAGIPRNTTVVSVNRDPSAAIQAISDLIIETDLAPFMKATLELLVK